MVGVMGFVERGPRRDGVGRCVSGRVSVVRALCYWGRGSAARGRVDRDVFLRMVVAALRSGRWGRVLCRRRARVWFPGMSICLVGCPWCSVRLF